MKHRRALGIAWTAAVLVVTACSSGAEDVITVRVDYAHDEFNTLFVKYFPDQIQVHPGDTVIFRQDWTGEAHTVTFGTKVNEAAAVTKPLIAKWGDTPENEIPPEVLEEYFAAECSLPVLYSCVEDVPGPAPENEEEPPPEEPATEPAEAPPLSQTLAQPCVIEQGPVPTDGAPCENQELGPFAGTEVYYNSGFLGFETEGANEFRLEVSESIEPGVYDFFCSVHGFFQSGTMEVAPPDQAIPSAREVNQQTRQELNEAVEPFREVYTQAQEGNFVIGGEAFNGNFVGLTDERVEGLLNEFVPKVINADVNEPITWLMFGPHSISFAVPDYFPIYETLEDGTVRAHEEVYAPAGGAPELEETDSPEPIVVDGGTWSGSGFWSSGVLYSEAYVQYTLRISTPGTYRYACLIHPPMVGTVEVSG